MKKDSWTKWANQNGVDGFIVLDALEKFSNPILKIVDRTIKANATNEKMLRPMFEIRSIIKEIAK